MNVSMLIAGLLLMVVSAVAFAVGDTTRGCMATLIGSAVLARGT